MTEQPPADAPTKPANQMAEPIEAVAAEVSFTVFAPSEGRVTGFYNRPRGDDPAVVHVHRMPEQPVNLNDGRFPAMLMLMESPSSAGVADTAEWEPIELADGPGWMWQPDGGGEVHVRVDRSGTCVWLRGLHDRAEALAIAGSLVPVTPRPPMA